MAERRRRRATSNEQQATSGEAPSADAGPQLDPVAPGRAIDEARRERDQALEQQRATAEVLRVISRSEEGLETSLQTVADAAARICRADLSQVWLRDGDYLVAGPSGPADAVSVLVKPGERLGPIADSPGPGLDAARTGRTVQVDDFERYLGERGGPRPLRSRRAAADPWGGARTVLAVPLLRTTETFGVLMLSRRGGGRTFDSGEIALAETFADQAAIAVVNARLFDELQQRNREQAEALEREQATAEVLRVISRSPESLDVALQAVADTAARLCRADVAQTWLRDGDFLVAGPTARLAGPADIFPPGRRLGPIATHAGPPPAAARTGKTVHVEDMLQYWVELGWTGNELEQAMELTRRIGARTVLAVPLLRGTDVVGVVALIRVDEVRRFAAREIALAETFADQAAIAVENAGLFQAIRESNRELTEALEQQTATADVLRIISEAPADLQRVLDALAENAARLCEGNLGLMVRRSGDTLRFDAAYSPMPDTSPFPVGSEFALSRGSIAGRAILDESVITHYGPIEERRREFPDSTVVSPETLARIAVPLLRDGQAVGALFIRRTELRVFSDREIALLQTFADQAVIAMENARLFDELQQRNLEQAEALEREQATAEVLRVISRSPEGLDDSLDAAASAARRLCGADIARLWLRDGDELVLGPTLGPAGFDDDLPRGMRQGPLSDLRGSPVWDAVRTGQAVHTEDVLQYWTEHDASPTIPAHVMESVRRQGPMTALSVPLLRGSEAVGVLTLGRAGKGQPFTLREIALAETFADQAAIAVENARLFQGIQDRNRELTEALEQQTATSDVLRIISRSPVDLESVLSALGESAARLCDASEANVGRIEDGELRILAGINQPVAGTARPERQLSADYVGERAALEGRTLNVAGDVAAIAADFPGSAALMRQRGVEVATFLGVPLLRDGRPVGVFALRRTDTRPFSDKQVALVETFADQAVIAMENARLFDELQQRNRDQAEALEREQATAEVLRVISRSPEDLDASLQAVAETAVRLCRADTARVFLKDGDFLVRGPSVRPPGRDEIAEPGTRWGPLSSLHGPAPRAALTGQTVHAEDLMRDLEEHGATSEPFDRVAELVSRTGPRASLDVPLLRGREVVGVLALGRSQAVGGFSLREIALAETFADQAAIAVENARLFQSIQDRNRELTEALQYQTATSDVLELISQSAFDLQHVLQALTENAARLCEADVCSLGRGRPEAVYGAPDDVREYLMTHELGDEGRRPAVIARMVREGRTVHVADVYNEPAMNYRRVRLSRRYPTRLAVPLRRGDEVIGGFSLWRSEVRPFSDRQIQLVETFADQAVIAIENARLFDELQERNREQAEALEREQATAEVLRVISRAPESLDESLQAVADTARRLCGADLTRVFLRDGEYVVPGPGSCMEGAEDPVPPGVRRFPITDEPRPAYEAIRTGRTVYREDLSTFLAERRAGPPGLFSGNDELRVGAKALAVRTVLAIPLLRGADAVGLLALRRYGEVRPFTQREIALAETFADQAAIAVENARLFQGIQDRNRELGEALEYQTATSDVLRSISQSAFDLKGVLETLAENAARLCQADIGVIGRIGSEGSGPEAVYGAPDEVREYLRSFRGTGLDAPTVPNRAAREGRTIQVADVYSEPGLAPPESSPTFARYRYPTRLAVPLRRDGEVIGGFSLWRSEVLPFSDRQVELVETFADQAVIAIENIRLFDELQQRNREQAEALEREQATAEVLRVISRSPESLDVALQAVADTAARLCKTDFARVWLREGDELVGGPTPIRGAWDQGVRRSLTAPRGGAAARAVKDGRTVLIEDIMAYLKEQGASDEELDYWADGIRRGAGRTQLAVPLLRGSEVVGALGLARREVRAFTDREIALAETFADQAAIAVENARLFQGIQDRNHELTEALEQQTATADVLRIISEAPADLQRVLDTLVTNAARLCDAPFGRIYRRDGNDLRTEALFNPDSAVVGELAGPVTQGTIAGRALLGGTIITDYGTPEERLREFPETPEPIPADTAARIVVPLLREGRAVGAFYLRRPGPRPYSERETGLLQTFADQAVIAMENARLFDELQERNREQAEALEREQATAEVLRVISRAPESLDESLQAVADTARRLCQADLTRVFLRDGDYLVAGPGARPDGADDPIASGTRQGPITADPSPLYEAILSARTVYREDVQAHWARLGGNPVAWAWPTCDLRIGSEARPVRTVLVVPLLRGTDVVGALTLRRFGEVRPFTARETALAETFADQAAIAVENARLFQGIQDRNRELTEALEQQTATADVLRIISEAPADLQRVLDALVSNAGRLCDAPWGVIWRRDGDAIRVQAAFNRDPGQDPAIVPDGASQILMGTITGRAMLTKTSLTDCLGYHERMREYPDTPALVHRGVAARMAVPLLREGTAVGAFFLRRPENRPFTDRDVALVKTFADQAVIAMENARLFDELQERNREQAEALEREHATAEVLRVISRSPESLDVALRAVAATAARLCRADLARVLLRDGDYLLVGPSARTRANVSDLQEGERRGPIDQIGTASAEAIRTGKTVHTHDYLTYLRRHKAPDAIVAEVGRSHAHAAIAVPMLRGTEVVGVLRFARLAEGGPFSDREIALAETFADQAAIAVENARLFKGIQDRNRELTEALEQQTATADVLRIISEAPADLQRVLDTLVANAVRLCDGDIGRIYRSQGGDLYSDAGYSAVPSRPALPIAPRPLSRTTVAGRAIVDATTVTDFGSPEHRLREFPDGRGIQVPGMSARIAVPLLREGLAVGALMVRRRQERPFSDREVALLQTFADQAVIAVENARLFDELQERNREQAEALEREQATAEVLRVISRSPEDLNASLQAVADTAARLCRADIARVLLREGEQLVVGPSARPTGAEELLPVGDQGNRRLFSYAAVGAGRTVRTENYLAYLQDLGASDDEMRRAVGSVDGERLTVAASVPMLRGAEAVGVLFVARRPNAGPFSDREIALAETFADQAAIAAENARLFQSIQDRNRELTEALEQQTATADVLRIISEAPADLPRVLDALAQNAARLCEASNVAVTRLEGETIRIFARLGGSSLRLAEERTLNRGYIGDCAILERRTLQIAGTPAELQSEFPGSVALTRELGFEVVNQLSVPLMREGEPIGNFSLRRPDARPFTGSQIALVETFADQAVIAMENARLFDELQERNREQAEALEREQATAEVLRVISRSPENLDAALQAVADTAARLCRADAARVSLREGDYLVMGQFAHPTAGEPIWPPAERSARISDPRGVTTHAANSGRTVHAEDILAYLKQQHAPVRTQRQAADRLRRGLAPRTQLGVPLLRGTEVVGVLGIGRIGHEPQPFSRREIALAETFADQAAIAVENARLFQGIQDRNRELTEALEQQTATADVLRIISAAPADLQRVLDALIENAVRLCDGDLGRIYRADNRMLRVDASYRRDGENDPGAPQRPLSRGTVAGRAIIDGAAITDFGDMEHRVQEFPETLSPDGVFGRIAVPLMRQGQAIGALFVRHGVAAPFSEREVALLQTFADQAVIAMENARLFDELQERNREQAEALEREQATAEVLRVISRSPESLDVALQAVADTATRLCRADFARLWLRDGDYLVPGPDALGETPGNPVQTGERIGPLAEFQGFPGADAALAGRTIHAVDILRYAEDRGASAATIEILGALHDRMGAQTVLAVPMLRGASVVGVVAFIRADEPRPFSDREIALAETFADQAAIAVENARLFQGIQDRNRELTEALEQQTATADVLRIISRSPVELEQVLAALAESAARLCEAADSTIFGLHGETIGVIGAYNRPLRVPTRGRILTRSAVPDRAVLERRTLHIVGEYTDLELEFPLSVSARRGRGEVRGASMAVPLMREGQPVGVFLLHRPEARPFTDKQIGLVETFADQAVIAMENARLFDELQERNREQAEALEREQATAEVLRVISRSPESLDVALQAVAATAARLCRADLARVLLRDGDYLVVGPSARNAGLTDNLHDGERRGPIGSIGTASAEAVLTKMTVHTPDYLAFLREHDAAEALREQEERPFARGANNAALAVPMLRGTEVVGVLRFVRLGEEEAFSDREIALAETFADQAAIAVENARLFQGIQDRNSELTEALEQQTATADVLRAISEAPADLESVLTTLGESAARLCGASDASFGRINDGRIHVIAGFNRPVLYPGRPERALSRDFVGERAALERRTLHVFGAFADLQAEFPGSVAVMRERGSTGAAYLGLPLLRDGQAIGVFALRRADPRPFTDKQIALAETFADQAVIAMENARLFEELQARTRELEAASSAKSEFLSRMSHELRTPLNAIIGFAEIMEMDPNTAPRQHDRVHHILGGGRHLLSLINEVLDITRIEAGRISLSPEPVQLEGVVQEVLDLERPLAAEADVELDLENPGAFGVSVQADRQRLRQIILNLVANAIKYNRPKGSVMLSVEQRATSNEQRVTGNEQRATGNEQRATGNEQRADEEQGAPSTAHGEPVEPRDRDAEADPSLLVAQPSLLRLIVRDTGPGIPADQIGRLFAPFERLSADSSGVEGTGLGLAIARGLAEAMGGTIGVESVVGEGSTFWVELPLAAGQAIPGGGVQDPALQDAGDAEEAAHTVMTVLYVEDNQPNVDLVQHVLQFRPGVTLLTAPDGATGVRIARRYRPGLVLLDLNLPDIQGDEVLARLRADDRTSAIPVVMISADATQGQIDRLLAAGARAYLTKPLDVRRLLEIVDEMAGDSNE